MDYNYSEDAKNNIDFMKVKQFLFAGNNKKLNIMRQLYEFSNEDTRNLLQQIASKHHWKF